MIEDYHNGTNRSRPEANAKVREFAEEYHTTDRKGPGKPILHKQYWNSSGWPTNADNGYRDVDLLSLYLLLMDGPIYAYYWSGTEGSGAHMVVITGVDVSSGLVYTNNPWNYYGVQTYTEFLNGVYGAHNDKMPLFSVHPVK